MLDAAPAKEEPPEEELCAADAGVRPGGGRRGWTGRRTRTTSYPCNHCRRLRETNLPQMEWLWSCEDDHLRCVFFCDLCCLNLLFPTLLYSTAPWCCRRCCCLLLSLLLPSPAAVSTASSLSREEVPDVSCAGVCIQPPTFTYTIPTFLLLSTYHATALRCIYAN